MTHIKRYSSPDFWPILTKKYKWVTSPIPGPHPKDYCIPLGIIIREILGYASNMKEVKIILSKKLVRRDKILVTDHRFPVGFMDTLEFEKDDKGYRLLPYNGIPLVCGIIPLNETNLKICKVINKTTLKRGRIQLNLHDGRNIILKENKDIKIGDSLLIELPSQEIKEIIKLEKNNYCLIYRGINAGAHGKLKNINYVVPKRNSIAEIEDYKGEIIRTNINYVTMIGFEKPLIKIVENEEDYVKPVIYKKMMFL